MHRFRGTATFAAYVTACDFEQSFDIDTTFSITLNDSFVLILANIGLMLRLQVKTDMGLERYQAGEVIL